MNDDGHKALLDVLAALILEAEAFEFHDFKNTKYAMPKIALYKKLLAIAEDVKKGRFDN